MGLFKRKRGTKVKCNFSEVRLDRKLETVRVKRKGQVTIPASLRRKCEIEEGDLLSVDLKDSRTIVLKLKEPLEPGKPVGAETQKRILRDLQKLRKNWR